VIARLTRLAPPRPRRKIDDLDLDCGVAAQLIELALRLPQLRLDLPQPHLMFNPELS